MSRESMAIDRIGAVPERSRRLLAFGSGVRTNTIGLVEGLLLALRGFHRGFSFLAPIWDAINSSIALGRVEWARLFSPDDRYESIREVRADMARLAMRSAAAESEKEATKSTRLIGREQFRSSGPTTVKYLRRPASLRMARGTDRWRNGHWQDLFDALIGKGRSMRPRGPGPFPFSWQSVGRG